MIQYSYGSIVLHDGSTYLVTKIDGISPVDWNITTAKIARTEGMKVVGQTIDTRTITLSMQVVTASRTALEAALDTLEAALNVPQQPLTLHSDNRYWIASCTKLTYSRDMVAVANVQVTFTCYQPYAYSATVQAQTVTGNVSSPITWTMTGGGTIFSHPQMKITNTDGALSLTTIAIQNMTSGQKLSLGTLQLLPAQYLIATGDPFDTYSYTVTKNGVLTLFYDFIGVFPTLDTGISNWQLTAATTGGTVQILVTWTPRYLS